ncbi:aromatic prenyltransferase [Sordaria brevicollis]|uniref:Aromatic prenyltransferase n=1 Tax=Sordaria brevicollis TaxID=83679 RepID=A0AAE0PLQ0_SORBR|nr:aromatic prenyltransferase [Sordaria brevicollis]
MPSHALEYPKQPYSTVKRLNDRARYSLETIHGIINASPFVHVAFQDSTSPFPAVLPMIGQMGSFSRPSADLGDVLDLYIHGYVSSRIMNLARASSPSGDGDSEGIPLTISATILDGYVLSLTPNSHSYNYRSANLFGYATPVTEPAEKTWAMELVTNSVIPQRYQNTRVPPNNAEMQSTSILKVKIKAGSAKIRSGEPHDERGDLADEELRQKTWVGVVPAWMEFGEPVAGGYNKVEKVPGYIEEWRVEGNEARRGEAYEAVKEGGKAKGRDESSNKLGQGNGLRPGIVMQRRLRYTCTTMARTHPILRWTALAHRPSTSTLQTAQQRRQQQRDVSSKPEPNYLYYDEDNPDHRYWWNACSPSLTSIFKHSNTYTPAQKALQLTWFLNKVIPNLGPRPSSTHRLQSPLNYDGTPYRPTWNLGCLPASGNKKITGTFRFSFEPYPSIRTAAAAAKDPTNQAGYQRMIPLLAKGCHGGVGEGEDDTKGADLTWYDEVKDHLYLTPSERAILHSKLAPGQQPPEHAALAIGFLNSKRVLKPYFFAGPKSLATGLSPHQMRPGREEPDVKVYLPIMQFFETEGQVVEALERVGGGFGWDEFDRGGYAKAFREAFPHVDLNEAPGTHTWLSFSYSKATGPYMTVYYAPRFQEAYDRGLLSEEGKVKQNSA